MRVLVFIPLLLLAGCTSNISMKKVPLDYLLNDSSSKVWLLNKVIDENGEDLAPDMINFRDIFIFYNTGHVVVQPLNSLGNKQGKQGFFFLEKENTQLRLEFSDEHWQFKVKTFELEKIELQPMKESDLKYELELIPLPEL